MKESKPAVDYTDEDVAKLMPLMERLQMRLQREQTKEATKAMMDFLGRYLSIVLGVE